MKANLQFERPAGAAQEERPQQVSSVRRLWPLVFAAVLSLVWLGAAAFVGWQVGLFARGAALSLVELSALIAGAVSPVAVVWLVALVFQRTDPLLERRLAVAATLNRALAPIDHAERRLDQLAAKLRRDVDHIDAAVDLAASRIDNLEDRFKSEVADLFAATADAEAKATTVKDLLRREREDLTALQQTLTTTLDETRQATGTFSQIIGEASGQAEETARSATERLDRQASALVDAATAADERIRSAEDALGERLQAVDRISFEVAHRLDGVTGDLQDQLAQMEARLAGLEEFVQRLPGVFEEQQARVGSLAEHTEAEAERIGAALARNSETLTRQAEGALTKSGEASGAIERQAMELDSIVTGTLDRARQTFRALADELTAQAGRVEGAARSQAENALAQVQAAIDGFEEKAAALDRSAEAAGQRVHERLSHLHGDFDREAAAMEARASQSVEQLSKLAEGLADQAEIVASAAGAAAKNMGEAGARMDERTANLGQVLDEMRRRIDEVADRLASESEGLTATSEAAAGTVLDAAERFRERSSMLSASSDEAAERLRSGAQTLNEEIVRLDERGRSAGQGLDEVAERLRSENSELMQMLDRSSAALGEAADAFSGERERVRSDTESVVGTLEDATRTVADKVAALGSAGEATRERLEGIATHFTASTEQILQAAAEAEAKAAASGAGLERTLSSAIAKGLREVGQSMDTLNTMFRAEVDDLEERIGKTLEETLGALRHAASQAGDESARMAEQLAEQSDKLVHRATSFLNKSEEIERRILANSRDEFVHTSSLLIESLQSASVDINKIMDTEVPDDVWQRYLAGDRSIFSRRTVRLGDRKSRKRIVEKFETDREFRDMVLKFFRDFEALMEQVMTRDKHSVLSVTLISSSMGKLYVLLAQSLKKLG